MADDTERLIVQLEARITDFEKNFAKAQRTADSRWSSIEARGKQAASRMQGDMGKAADGIVSALNGISPAIAGGLGLGAVLTAAASINRELAKMGDLSKRVGLTTDRFQELQFGASVGGVSNEAFAAGIGSIGKLLNDAKRDENDLSRLFAANNVSLKDREGKLISVNVALSKAADLVRNAGSEFDKIKIAEMLGLSKDWVRALEGGSEAWNKNAAGAREAGAIINREIIERADKFQRDWDTATTRWAAGFKSAASEIIPLITDIAETAMKAAPFLMKGASLFGAQLKAAFGGIDSLSLQQLKLMEQLTRPFELDGRKFGNADENAKIKERIALLEKEGEAQTKLTVTKRTGAATIIPKAPKDGEDDKDAFDRAQDSMQKRIALLDADTAAVGMNEEARARLRAVAELEDAARRANRDAGLEDVAVTDKQREAINKLADAMAAAAKRRQDSHVQLMQFAADGQNFAKQFDQVATSGFANFENALVDVVSGTKTAEEAFSSMTKSILADLAKMIIRMQITAPLAAALGGMFGGGGGVLAGGLPLGMGGIGHNAQGTDNWRGGWSWVGERGPEIVNLPKGARVVPNHIAMRAPAVGGGVTSNGPAPVVNVRVTNNAPGAQATARQRPDGSIDVIVDQIDKALASRAASGRGAMAKTFQRKTIGFG